MRIVLINKNMTDPVPASAYVPWAAYAEFVANNNDLFQKANWKVHGNLNYMLEHVTHDQGLGFLLRILSEYKLDNTLIEKICNMNDFLGQPTLYDVGLEMKASPSSLRYIFHACEILSAIKKIKDEINIVEVGCGYGGLAIVLNALSDHFGVKINKYALFDMPSVQKLQQKYIEHHTVKYEVIMEDCFNFGARLEGSDWFLVSAYGIGEFETHIATNYLTNILPKTVGGFIVWNAYAINPILVGDKYRVEKEDPLTGCNNRVIKW